MAPIHEACRDGDTERVGQLLDEGAPVDEKDADRWTALMEASRHGRTEIVQLLLGKGAAIDAKDKDGWTALMKASNGGHTEVVQLLLEKGAAVDEKSRSGWTALMWASNDGHTEVVQLLLDKGAPVDEKNKRGRTALMEASYLGHTEVVQLLLDKGAPVDEKDNGGRSALTWASEKGRTEVVQLLLGKGAAVDEKDRDGGTALMAASLYGGTAVAQLLLDATVKQRLEKGASLLERDKRGVTLLMHASEHGHTEVVRLLLDKGAPVDEKDPYGSTALMLASKRGHTEIVQLLLGKGAALDEKDKHGSTALPGLVEALAPFDEDQLGRMAAVLVQGQLLQAKGQDNGTLDAVARAVLQLVHLAGFSRERALKLRSSDPRSADDHQVLFGRLQLAAAACVQNDESGKARGWNTRQSEPAVHTLLRSDDGRKALEHAVQIEAKELLAQPVVQGYIKVAWQGVWKNLFGQGDLFDGSFLQNMVVFAFLFVILLLQLLFILPLVALVPALEPSIKSWLANWLAFEDCIYLLGLPVVKFGLECAADLALALALTLIPTADLAASPVAPLLLVWVGSGLLWEGRQLISFGSEAPAAGDTSKCCDGPLARAMRAASSRLAQYLAAYWADSINRVDATALIFSFAALIASLSSTDDNGDATATSLRVVAVFLLWFRLLRVLLISPRFGPYVLMFFRMLFGDLVSFLVLLLFLLLAFAASFTVLLEPEPTLLAQQSGDDQNWRWTPSHTAHLETAGCADELGGLDVVSTLTTLVEGALTGNDFFECVRDSTKSPWATWVISLVFVTLTSVLLLNMLIAMCAALRSRRTAKSLWPRTSCGAHLRLSCVLLTGWPRPLTTSRRHRQPTTSSYLRRGRSLSRTSRQRRRR